MKLWLQKLFNLYQEKEKETASQDETRLNETSSEKEVVNQKDLLNTYITDAPVDDPDSDYFKRYPFAKHIAHTVAMRQDPSSIVIGIYGIWGEGKTSVLRFIERELKQNPDIICVTFNPWRFADEHQLLHGFFNTLASSLSRSLASNKEKVGDILSKYVANVIPTIKVAEGVEISLSESAKSLGQTLASVELEELKKRLETILKTEGKRVVILMDDIDRLDKAETQAVFKLVKLTADFSYTAYVLAMDEEVVAAALGEKYGAGNIEAGRNFLEKIVQVPLRLPRADILSLRIMCFQAIDQALNIAEIKLTDEQSQKFARAFVDGLEIKLHTPRMVKRYTNALMFALPILKGEVHPVDLLLIEGVRVFYPALYDTIRRNPQLFLGSTLSGAHRDYNEQIKSKTKETINNSCAELTPDEQNAAQTLITTLFPKLEYLYRNISYGSDWDVTWSKEQRIASSQYFDRYFSYTVPEGDISDQQLEEFFTKLETISGQESAEQLKLFITDKTAEKLASKLRGKAKSLLSQASKNLAIAISQNGHMFPNPEAMWSHLVPFSQMAMCIHDVIKNIPSEEGRFVTAKTALDTTPSLPFAVETYRWLRVKKQEDDGEFSETEEKELGLVIAERIKSHAQKSPIPIYIEFPQNSLGLLSTWFHHGNSKDEVRQYIRETIQKNPLNSIEFIKNYIPTSWGLESGLSSKSDFERENYNSIVQFVEPELIFTSLKIIYGNALETPNYNLHGDEVSLEEQIAHQFSYIHHQVIEQQKQSENEIKTPEKE